MGICVLKSWLHDSSEAGDPLPLATRPEDDKSGGYATTSKEPTLSASRDGGYGGSPAAFPEPRQGPG